MLCIPNHHHQTPYPSMYRHFSTCRPRAPGNPEMILQRVIKKSESVINGLKLALWGSTYSLKSFSNKKKKKVYTDTHCTKNSFSKVAEVRDTSLAPLLHRSHPCAVCPRASLTSSVWGDPLLCCCFTQAQPIRTKIKQQKITGLRPKQKKTSFLKAVLIKLKTN